MSMTCLDNILELLVVSNVLMRLLRERERERERESNRKDGVDVIASFFSKFELAVTELYQGPCKQL